MLGVLWCLSCVFSLFAQTGAAFIRPPRVLGLWELHMDAKRGIPQLLDPTQFRNRVCAVKHPTWYTNQTMSLRLQIAQSRSYFYTSGFKKGIAYVYVYIYIYTCMYLYIYIYIYMYVCEYIIRYVRAYTFIEICLYIYTLYFVVEALGSRTPACLHSLGPCCE